MATATSSSNAKSPKQLRCSICGRIFDSTEALNAHQKMEHGSSSHPPAGVA
jgi:Zinc finger, C2H2 type